MLRKIIRTTWISSLIFAALGTAAFFEHRRLADYKYIGGVLSDLDYMVVKLHIQRVYIYGFCSPACNSEGLDKAKASFGFNPNLRFTASTEEPERSRLAMIKQYYRPNRSENRPAFNTLFSAIEQADVVYRKKLDTIEQFLTTSPQVTISDKAKTTAFISELIEQIHTLQKLIIDDLELTDASSVRAIKAKSALLNMVRFSANEHAIISMFFENKEPLPATERSLIDEEHKAFLAAWSKLKKILGPDYVGDERYRPGNTIPGILFNKNRTSFLKGLETPSLIPHEAKSYSDNLFYYFQQTNWPYLYSNNIGSKYTHETYRFNRQLELAVVAKEDEARTLTTRLFFASSIMFIAFLVALRRDRLEDDKKYLAS